MVFSTESPWRSLLRSLVLLLSLLTAQGCATARLFEAGRHTEAVLRYESAYTDGRQLWLVYSARLAERENRGPSLGTRSAVIELAVLDPAAGYPLDAVPLERVAVSDVPSQAAQPVALRVGGKGSEPGSSATPSLLVEAEAGRHTGFALAHFEAVPGGARFYSGALVQRRTAAWVYPVLPLALVWDVVWTPVLASLAAPLLLVGE